MRKAKYILICVLVVVTVIYGAFRFMPVRIYLMPIDAWERKIWNDAVL